MNNLDILMIIFIVGIFVIVYIFVTAFTIPENHRMADLISTTDCSELKQLVKNYTGWTEQIKTEYWLRCDN